MNNLIVICFPCDLANEKNWKPRSFKPETISHWNDKDWTSVVVDRFLYRYDFPDEEIYQNMLRIGNEFLIHRIGRVAVPEPACNSLCLWNDQDIINIIQNIGEYFFHTSAWEELFGYLKCIKLLVLDKFCCFDPFDCARALAHWTKRYVLFRTESFMEYNGGWRIGLTYKFNKQISDNRLGRIEFKNEKCQKSDMYLNEDMFETVTENNNNENLLETVTENDNNENLLETVTENNNNENMLETVTENNNNENMLETVTENNNNAEWLLNTVFNQMIIE